MYDIQKEKNLAFLLRHDDVYDLTPNGWREVSDLVEHHDFTQEELETIVAESNKQRFEFSKNGLFVRALYGHSVEVDVGLEEVIPTGCLYHGTTVASVASIMEKGLLPRSRQCVHLSEDEETAAEVGNRRKGDLAILRVDAPRMYGAGYRMWRANNGVWITKMVPPEYISKHL